MIQTGSGHCSTWRYLSSFTYASWAFRRRFRLQERQEPPRNSLFPRMKNRNSRDGFHFLRRSSGRRCASWWHALFGSGAPVRGLRMQSFSRDPSPGDGGHPRTTAVSVADLLGGVIEGQVPGVDRSFAAKSATGRNGSTGDITGWRSGRSAGRCAGSGNYRPPATALNLDGLAFVADYIVS